MENTMDNYVDIHSHILYGIDDGSKSINESIEIIKQHKEMGFKDIVVTPHYIENSEYITNNKEKNNILETLKKELKKQNIDINLYLGNEVFVNNNLEQLLKNNEISSINNSKYLLIELPMHNKIKNITDIIYELRIKGIIPIIAHPERYEFVKKKPESVQELIEEGAILQFSILATDIHFPNNKIYLNMNTIRKKITKIIGEEKSKELMITNPKKVIENKPLS